MNAARLRDEAGRVRRGVRRRALVALASTGDAVACCYCGWSGRWFLPAGLHRTPNRKCPQCGSLERYRMLYLFLERRTGFFRERTTVLEIGPKKCFADLCRSIPTIDYIGVDIGPAGASVQADITRLPLRDASVDLVVCFHVLEHIVDDAGAMAEIRRVIRPGGQAVLQVPIRGEVTFEDPSARPEDHERLFGQADHVRWYGLDVADRVVAAGLDVELDRPLEWLDDDTIRRQALEGDDQVLVVGRAR